MASHAPARVTLAELVAALSLASDLGMGRPMERVLRQTVIAMRLGKAAGMGQATCASAYYTSLLTWVGCATETSEVAALFGDETELYADTRDEDLGGVTLAAFVARHLGGGKSGFRRIGMVGKFLATAGRSVQQVMMAHCQAASDFADWLELGPGVCEPLLQTFERWDGRGVPGSAGADALAPAIRLVQLADIVEAFHHAGGTQAALKVARERRGTQFDPDLVDCFCARHGEILDGLGGISAWDEVIALDPRLRAALTGILANDELLRARAVVLATGACVLPAVPGISAAVPPWLTMLTPLTYRDAGQLPDGGVLVVGASATGVQLAGEIHSSGRPVTLAAGEHVRLPRTYRGRDIFWWLEATGLLGERYDQIDDLTRARHLPSPQLTGASQATMTDLNTLATRGVRITGRLGRIADGVAQFSGSLANTCALADLKMNRFLNRSDEWATASGLDGELAPPHRFVPTRVDPRSPLELDLRRGQITTILWATGFRPDHSWLDIPVRDRTGHIRHDGGVVTGAPGLYLLGMPVLRTRASTYIHGAGADSDALAGHLHSFLGSQRRWQGYR